MEETSVKTKKPHLGRNIMRLRELQGMKQETLASLLGISQQAVSKMEGSESIEEERLSTVAKALNVHVEVLKNFSEDSLIFNIANMNDQSSAYNQNYNYQCNIGQVDKLLEVVEENKKLYEALLKSEREKIALLERLLGEKK